MAREAFNWSALDRSVLYSMLYKLKPEIVNKRLPVVKINKLLSQHIKQHLPINIVRSRLPLISKNEIWIGGAYYSELDKLERKRFIEVEFVYSSKISTVQVSNYRWERMCNLFADTVLHEIIHTRQYRARGFKLIPGYESTAYYARTRREQEYYGHRDEMGAHAFNLAQDMIDKFGWDVKAIKKYLDSKVSKRSRPTGWGRFIKAFEYNYDHPKVCQMKRKILSQLEYAYNGKPFKTQDHLTY
jgi:hypothetical protein